MSRRKDCIDSLLDGASRLHRAAATKTQHQVRELINQGANPNLRNWRGESPLHRAAIRNPDLDVHRALIGAGADVNARDEKGATPLHRAAPHASSGRGNLLIEAGASVDVRDKSGAAPLHYAAESGRDRMIARLIEAGASLNSQDHAGKTPLRIAVENGWAESTRTLLNHGADPNVPDNEGRIPLHSAYAAGRQDMVNRLLEAGTNLEARVMLRTVSLSNTFRTGRTMEGEGNTSKSRELTTPATFATKKLSSTNCEQTGRSMSGFRMLSIRADPEGRTLLHRAAEKGSSLGVHRLLQEGADPNVRDNAAWTPLDRAAESLDGAETVERLLEAGANPHFPAGQDQQTPLHLAVQSDSPESVNHLLDASANPGVTDSEGRTPLHYAAANGSPDITETLARGRGRSERAG